MRHGLIRFMVRRLAVLALIFFIPVPAAADDAIMSVDQYKTAKARTLATTHQGLLKQVREEIYQCMPWVGVQKAGIGFRQPKGAVDDDRYLSVWIVIDQDEDARFSALPTERRASAMFSRYGTDLLRRMAQLQPAGVRSRREGLLGRALVAEAGYRRQRRGAAGQRDARALE